MEVLKNCFMGVPFRRIGNLIYRNFGGKNYVIVRPIYTRISRSGKIFTLEVDLKYTPILPDPTWFQVFIISAKFEPEGIKWKYSKN